MAATVRKESTNPGGRYFISGNLSEVKTAIKEIMDRYPPAGYGTFVKDGPSPVGDGWMALVVRYGSARYPSTGAGGDRP